MDHSSIYLMAESMIFQPLVKRLKYGKNGRVKEKKSVLSIGNLRFLILLGNVRFD